MNRKSLAAGIGAALGIGILIIDSGTAFAGARDGIQLCIQTVIPSLFPFFVLSAIITDTFMGRTGPILKPLGKLFFLPEGTETILIPAFLGGYPVGAKAVATAFQNGQLDREEAERILPFCNNPGPAFLFGMGSALFTDKRSPWILWGILVLSAFAVARITPTIHMKLRIPVQNAPQENILHGAIKAMASVCGWVILMRVLIAFCIRWFLWYLPNAAQILFIGTLELANGCAALCGIPGESIRFLLAGGMFAFGGVCVTLQTVSVTHGLSIKKYLLGKALQTAYTLLISLCICSHNWLLLGVLVATVFIFPIKTKKSGSIPKKAIV